jgi:hypothetical protein
VVEALLAAHPERRPDAVPPSSNPEYVSFFNVVRHIMSDCHGDSPAL